MSYNNIVCVLYSQVEVLPPTMNIRNTIFGLKSHNNKTQFTAKNGTFLG